MITFERIGPQAPPFVLERLAAIFSSDPEFLETTEGARAFCVDDVVRYLENEEAMRAEAYAIVREADGTILGVVTLLPHHPREPHPWIGLLLVDVGARGRGLGSQAADLAESTLRARGFSTVRLGVHHQTPRSRAFWEARGYRAVEDRKTGEGRPVTVYQNSIA